MARNVLAKRTIRLEILDIVLHLSTIGAAKAYDPSHCATIYKRPTVQDLDFWSQRYHPRLVVLEPVINNTDSTVGRRKNKQG